MRMVVPSSGIFWSQLFCKVLFVLEAEAIVMLTSGFIKRASCSTLRYVCYIIYFMFFHKRMHP